MKVKQDFVNKEAISKRCEYCTYGKLCPDGETVLCIKKGPVRKEFSCVRYKYDILKRQPRELKFENDFKEEDFKL